MSPMGPGPLTMILESLSTASSKAGHGAEGHGERFGQGESFSRKLAVDRDHPVGRNGKMLCRASVE